MKKDMANIEFESRREVDVLQNVIEIAIADGNLNDDEKEVATKLSAMLEEMYISWQLQNSQILRKGKAVILSI